MGCTCNDSKTTCHDSLFVLFQIPILVASIGWSLVGWIQIGKVHMEAHNCHAQQVPLFPNVT